MGRKREGRRGGRERRKEMLCLLSSCYALDSFKYILPMFVVPVLASATARMLVVCQRNYLKS